MNHELLFEIGTEELPVGFILPAIENLKKNIGLKLKNAALPFHEIKGLSTPRRLTLCVSGLAERQPDREEQIMGPPKKAAIDADGNFTKAAEGFARSRGVTVNDLQTVNTSKGDYLMVSLLNKGEETINLLTGILTNLVLEIPFPKSMFWGTGEIGFARPIQWLLTIYNGSLVPMEINGIAAGETTRGHRFMSPDPVVVRDYEDYLNKLSAAHVLADFDKRRQAVAEEISRAAGAAGGQIHEDLALLDTVTNLVEKPHAVCGAFDKKYLDLPGEVLITSMREHQKYFSVTNADGDLMPFFVAVNNTKVKDVKTTAIGHQRVLRARLEDALFFFNADQDKTLAERVPDLDGVIFQAELGTLLEKTERITKLAGTLARELAPEHLKVTERAAHLAKTDLLTAMVKEFPSLQGMIGRDYASLNDEHPAVAKAIHEHYLPVRAGDRLPTAIPGALVGLADRMDSIAGCFGIGQVPTGNTDPYGLRRLALGLLHIIEDQEFTLPLIPFVEQSLFLYGGKLSVPLDTAQNNIMEFLKGRFVNDLIALGVQGEAVEAVTSVTFNDVVDCRKRINALIDISGQPAFALLAGAFKRVINIIKDHRQNRVDPGLFSEKAEKKLYDGYLAVNEEAAPFLEDRQYYKAMEIILKMKEPVDTFFDEVMVMVEDTAVRNNRLSLLASISQLFLKIGDFSKMYTVA